jgi:hypothetical protein
MVWAELKVEALSEIRKFVDGTNQGNAGDLDDFALANF